MKNFVVSAITALLVALICFVGLRFTLESQNASPSSLKPGDFASGIKANLDSIAALQGELREIRTQVNQTGRLYEGESPDTVHISDANHLIERIEALEEALKETSIVESTGGKAQSDVRNKQFAESLSQTSELSTSNQVGVLESDFEADSGIPLGDYADSIGETLYLVEGLHVSGMDCRDTICKVTYSKPELLGSQADSDGTSELVDKLVQASNGREVEIRYAKDPSGDEVMYIQLR